MVDLFYICFFIKFGSHVDTGGMLEVWPLIVFCTYELSTSQHKSPHPKAKDMVDTQKCPTKYFLLFS